MSEFLSITIPEPRRGVAQPTAPGTTRVAELRALLAEEIVCGRLAPGAPLEEVELARRYRVSRTPVREAIRELAATGLVEARPHRSAIVAKPSRERLRAMFDTLAELEALCAGLAALNMSAAELARLEELHQALGAQVRGGDAQRYHAVNEAFHGAIYAGSQNSYLAELTTATRTLLSPFSRMQFRSFGRLNLSHGEHDRVVTAILNRDQATAAAAMRDHIAAVEITFDRSRVRL